MGKKNFKWQEVPVMKQVIIIIRPNMYYKTKEKLIGERFFSMSTKEVLGRGKKTIQFINLDNEKVDPVYSDTMIAKRLIEIYVRDEDVDRLIHAVMEVNHNNAVGDGKIFVIPVENCIRTHTGEKGDQALI
jgi:nitrogen regulatory protein PII 2